MHFYWAHRFNGHFSGEPELAAASFFFFDFFWKRTIGDKWNRFVQAGCSSCLQTTSVEALEET